VAFRRLVRTKVGTQLIDIALVHSWSNGAYIKGKNS